MILVFGSISLDLVFDVERLPGPGETVIGPHAHMEAGGKGANQAVAASRDGARVVMAGAVGRDALGDRALAMLGAEAMDLARVARVDALTGCAAVSVDAEGQNQVVAAAGANLLARNEQVEEALLTPDTTLVVQMECDHAQTETMIRRARARGCRIILNLSPPAPVETRVLRDIDVVVVNQEDADWLGRHLGTGHNAASLSAALDCSVVVTNGVMGAECYTAAGYHRVKAAPVKARDTTAAGDCFVGVLAAALDRGMGMAEAMRRANLAAGLACTRAGTQASLPRGFEIDAHMPSAPEIKDQPPTERD